MKDPKPRQLSFLVYPKGYDMTIIGYLKDNTNCDQVSDFFVKPGVLV
jgi:hypothetical protein